MRILHTSDWHIGRTFHGVDLLVDQESSLMAIAELVAAERVDVVVLPGDVYDRSIPSADAIAVCNRGFEAIRAAGATIVATSGNHDSPTRLGALGSFAAAGGLHLRCGISEVARPILVSDGHGEVAFYGIPYLEPEITRVELGVPQARSHAEILDAAMGLIRADLGGRAGVRSVVLAHAFVVGGEATGSERSISVGGVETVPLSAFDGIDYVALGHLHSPQTLSESVRYSGSPLPYSFGERSHRKAVWIVELDAAGLTSVERRELPVVRGLSQLSGTLEELLGAPEYAGAEADYVSATLTDTARPVDALRRLRDRFPHAVHVEWVRPEGNPELRYRERVHGRRDTEIAQSFLTDVRGEPTAGEMTWLERALAAAVREKDGPVRMANRAAEIEAAVRASLDPKTDSAPGVELDAETERAARGLAAAEAGQAVRGAADEAPGLFDTGEDGGTAELSA
ncbi:exonuclease SbcCD subunit D [Nocardia sp. NPDC051030]|uniref:exonuclease SbcCD subunit D n=1 Tax=Nocardia sp. NPDC051030 TaxID=3155162 RepID=UPI00342E16D4